MEILLVQTAFLGDLLLSIPLIRGIYKNFPGSKITLVCRKGTGSIFRDLKLVDQVYEVEKGDPNSYIEVQKRLLKKEWQYIFCPHESYRSAAFVKPLKAQYKIGFWKWWNFLFFNRRTKRDMRLPDALRQLSLLNTVSEKQKEIFNKVLADEGAWNLKDRSQNIDFRKFRLPEWASMKVKPPENLKLPIPLQGKNVFLFPGSVWATKRWTEEGFVGIARKFKEDGFNIHWMGSGGESELCERLAAQVPGSVSHAGKLNLTESFLALTHGHVLISNDSGSMHLGAMAGIPTVAIFGPTVLDIGYRPWQTQAVVVQKNLNCRPCGLHGHQVCPLGHHNCMKQITAEEVYSAAKSL